MQETRVGVKQRHLLGGSRNNGWMTMTD